MADPLRVTTEVEEISEPFSLRAEDDAMSPAPFQHADEIAGVDGVVENAVLEHRAGPNFVAGDMPFVGDGARQHRNPLARGEGVDGGAHG